MSLTGPRVTVGLPVYNGERYLSETIQSVLLQTFPSFELVISDNGSTDGTREICEAHVKSDPRIRYVRHQVNRGASWNFKHVVELARGEYFRWVSADDLFAQESLACCVEVLDQCHDVVLCYPQTVLIDMSGEIIGGYDDLLDLQNDSPVERFLKASQRNGLVNVHYGLMRSHMLKAMKLIANYPGADRVFVLDLALRGKFIEIKRPLFFRRIHEGASSQMKTIEELQVFMDPATQGHRFLRRWRTMCEKISIVLQAGLGLTATVQLLFSLLREMVASRDEYLKELLIYHTTSTVRNR